MEKYIEDLIAGDISGLHHIYETYRIPIYAFILSLVRNSATAEDLLQETFIKCYMRIDQYHQGSYFKAWIYAIARNLCYDYLKSQKYQYESLDDITPSIEIEEGILQKLQVSKEIFSLEEIDREIIILHIVAGFKHHEIAKELGINENTVRWRYSKAIKQLRKQLGGD